MASEVGYPVVLKGNMPNLPHKTEAGLVMLGLRDEGAVRAAYDQILSNSAGAGQPLSEGTTDGGGINGVSVQEMVLDAVEVIVGVTYDSQLGPTVLFGSGGVMVDH